VEVITTHSNADFDTVASMVAARKLYPDAVIVMPGTQEESVKGFLLQSALYNLDMKKAGEVDLGSVTRLILVDIRNSARIGPFRHLVGKPGVEIHLYDHHPDSDADIRGDLEVVRPVGSTATIMVGLLQERGLTVTPDEATVMMLGIYEDTGSLLFPSTTPEDCRAAAWLLERGGSLATVSDVLVREITSDQVSLLYDLMQGSRPYIVHGVEVIVAEARREDYAGEIAPLVHRLRDMEGAGVLFAICQMGDRVVVVARSRRPEVDVGAVMRELGGGGHAYAASAAMREVTTTEVRERILRILGERVIRRKTAADLMVSPVHSANAGDPVFEAHALMSRYNLNAVPVLQGGEVVGIITRQVAEKAIYHGLKDEKITEYMTTDFDVAPPGESVERVQEILIGKNQRLIPVVGEKGTLVGIITRTGLLRHLHAASRQAVGAEVEEAFPTGGLYSRPKRVANLMRDRLPESVMALLREAGQVAASIGMKAYLVGGFVRDLVMRLENFDIDLVIEGDGIRFAEHFSKVRSCRVRAHHKFGTAVMIFPDGFKLDVATARVEYYVEPAALPTVSFSSMKQDLYRRDFTINTLAVRLDGDQFGELVDYFGAQRDIKDRAIRVLHSLSFVEDPTRILRACRFEQRFGFAIARNTRNLIRNAIRLDLIGKLPKPRLNSELELILKESDPVGIVRRMSELGIGPSIHPEITLNREQLSLMGEVGEVLVWFSMLYLDEKVERWMVYYLALLDPLSSEEAIAFGERLGLGRKLRSRLTLAKETGEGLLRRLFGLQVVSRKVVRDIFHDLPNEVILYLMAKAKHPDIKRYISLYFTQLKHIRLFTTGDDLVAMGYPPGPQFKTILDGVLEKRLSGEIKTRKGEAAWIRRHYPPASPGDGSPAF
jgi:tRNA nucleotidyltransferase (CCA-adding enzyme)